MEKQKALELIKQVVNQAVKRGLFENVETTVAVAQALETIAKELSKDEIA
jgi:hypothetical protein